MDGWNASISAHIPDAASPPPPRMLRVSSGAGYDVAPLYSHTKRLGSAGGRAAVIGSSSVCLRLLSLPAAAALPAR